MDYEYFMKIALAEAGLALADNEFPVGCVLVHDKAVVGRGRRRNSSAGFANELDHAEITALRNLADKHPGIKGQELVAISTMEPCLMCYATFLLNGIRKIVYALEDVMGGGTKLDLSQLSPLYQGMEVTVIHGVLRDASLEIFKEYFSNPANAYLRGSLLAEYTLAQNPGEAGQ